MRTMSGEGVWIKTESGWRLPGSVDSTIVTAAPTASIGQQQHLYILRPGERNNDREISQAKNVRVIGSNAKWKVTVCFSEFIENVDMFGAATDQRRFVYLCDLLQSLFKRHWSGMSSTAHGRLFRVLELMVSYATSRETNIQMMKGLLETARMSIMNSMPLIGPRTLWKRYFCTISNLCIKMDNFRYTEREEDGLPCLLDLPKEVLREIVKKISDPKDLGNLGATCLDLYYLTVDPSLWEELAQFHFQEKQMLTFIQTLDKVEGTAFWKEMIRKCCRKYGMQRCYTDQLVVCTACKTMHWLMLGHICVYDQGNGAPYSDVLSVQELIKSLDL